MSTERLLGVPVKIFADGADFQGMLELHRKPYIQGLTTNPTLMKKAGVTDYEVFARSLLEVVRHKPVCFEVFSDDFPDMRRQARKIAAWQTNVYVKIPITNTKGESSAPLIRELAAEGVKVNVTALLTREQAREAVGALHPETPSIVSIFAGRVADTGIDPMPLMRECRDLLRDFPMAELLWASVRESLNILQAAQCGCHIVTVTHDVLAKASQLWGMDCADLSLDTVRMFYRDAQAAGYQL